MIVVTAAPEWPAAGDLAACRLDRFGRASARCGQWVGGFDVLYALLDEAFDRKEGLYSIPSRFGRPTALDLGLMLHGAALLCLGALVHHYFEPRLGLTNQRGIWLIGTPPP